MSELRPVTVITGASSGIGAALTREFARNDHTLVLVARRQDRMQALADEIAASGRPKPLVIVADLQRTDGARLVGEVLRAQGVEPQFIVNNAGFGLVGSAASLDREEQLQMIDLNIRALTELSLAFVDSLARHRGGILNVGSVAGFLPGPGMAVYYASKAYVLHLTEAIAHETRGSGVKVTAVCPGVTESEFAEVAGLAASRLMHNTAMTSREVARLAIAGHLAGHRVVVTGAGNKFMPLAARLLPTSLLMRVVARLQKK